MKIQNIQSRAKNQCELCRNAEECTKYLVPPRSEETEVNYVYICTGCHSQLKNPESIDPNHWRCLNDSMWSDVPAVQVLVWRMLSHLAEHGWPQELLDRLYLEEDTQNWAESAKIAPEQDPTPHDSNGVKLADGDTVTLIKDLEVKGSSFTAKRGTPVRRIRLVDSNHEHIEGKVNDQQIIILTKFVKKVS